METKEHLSVSRKSDKKITIPVPCARIGVPVWVLDTSNFENGVIFIFLLLLVCGSPILFPASQGLACNGRCQIALRVHVLI